MTLPLLVAIHCSHYCHPRPPSRPHTHTRTTTTTIATTITSTIIVVITTIVLGTECFNVTSDDKRPPNISYAPFFKLYAIWRAISYIRLLVVAHDFGSSRTDLLHVVTHASTNALPVLMLRQVYLRAPKW